MMSKLSFVKEAEWDRFPISRNVNVMNDRLNSEYLFRLQVAVREIMEGGNRR